MQPRWGPLLAAGTVLGVGMGGFVDGIVLHQLLQVHEMVSGWRPPVTLFEKSLNMFWDGVFHSFTWLTTAVGIALLWRLGGRPDVPRSGLALSGALLLGWGLFNGLEGLVDHLLLGLHNVVEDSPHRLAWNLGFEALAAGQVIAGWALIRAGRRRFAGRAPAPQPRAAELAGYR